MAKNKESDEDVCAVLRGDEAIDAALEQAGRDAIRHHQMTGVPLVYWENSKIIYVDPFTGQEVPEPKDTPEELAKYRPVPYYLHAL